MKASQQESMAGHGPTSQDRAMMEKTIHEARRAIDAGKAGVAALLLWHEEIVALGHNQYAETGDLTAHAEMVVLRSAAALLNALSAEEKTHLTLYVTLEPCLMCLSAISLVGIKRVVYAALAGMPMRKSRLLAASPLSSSIPCSRAVSCSWCRASCAHRGVSCWRAWENSASS